MSDEPAVIVQYYDLLRWLMGRVAKYPRDHRFTLGDRTISLGLDVLENLLEAAYSKNKAECLRAADLCLAKLRYLIRLAKDERCVSLKQYEFASREMAEVGKQIGGWRKQAAG